MGPAIQHRAAATNPRHQIKPDGVRLAEPVQWGLVPSWSKDTSSAVHMINARSDTVSTKPAFRTAFRHSRCLIPANGFYEWQHIDKKTKQPWHIFRNDGQPLVFTGLFEHWQSPDGDVLESCSIITTEANNFMAEIHTRMPVILPREKWSLWLNQRDIDPAILSELLVPCPGEWLTRTPVSNLINKLSNDSPDCIQPVKQLRTLF